MREKRGGRERDRYRHAGRKRKKKPIGKSVVKRQTNRHL